ncbi:MAG: 1-(5-phosphoribosyl)-5-amino-4-imidazole-carboxylate (AIR) carboxylase, 5-(carboxyamino)imidazole ribonucleotide mutase [Candidatus Peregrinibacteria bacterium GW2011_GWE2_39_6]|nr:MAG: 1-(5-phosphoribosyl)-5-amino-4-imidazole-carboxylate (AIR) carboxylase, 5-(carboxyamino)imidazole ribonucleotide mutase [Candidatus Peregrinibacteria bacterium GW2011_GWF2_39_17]KKR26601.1 MAG: 1-(5-phosphoribosyl)-5-amino-4-imidazole-carboxylate (AIR) carboxylase, 5-(carboxyamino)imidazole ribonucleotide mutase [Candidatus Peregrinibacteria bacterium GW2011_GWE2_39_6]HCW32495.1 5-(carboxyamino)imidazole ribonucleotide mutase [Candidatus Peregrinibacteria bacterium]
MLVPILMGSTSDQAYADKIAEHLKTFEVETEFHVCSAHKVPEKVIEIISKFNISEKKIVYITIAGRSNGLSGVVAGSAIHPVIACPPFADKVDYLINIHSSTMMPSNTPSMTVVDPQNAAMAAIRILALTNKNLQQKVVAHIKSVKESS